MFIWCDDLAQMIPSFNDTILTIRSQIIVYLSITEMSAVEQLGNLGHLLRKLTVRLLSHTHNTDIYPFASFTVDTVSMWNMASETNPLYMYLEIPFDMEQEITRRQSDIFRLLLPLRWGWTQRDFWVIAHLNNAKCVLLCAQEAGDAKWRRVTGNSWWDVLLQKSFHVPSPHWA